MSLTNAIILVVTAGIVCLYIGAWLEISGRK